MEAAGSSTRGPAEAVVGRAPGGWSGIPAWECMSSRPESCQVHPAYDLPTVWRRRSQARALLGHRQGGAGRLAVLRDGALLKVASPPRDLSEARLKRVSNRPAWGPLLVRGSIPVWHTVVRSQRASSWWDAPLAASRAHASCTSDRVISAVSAQRRLAPVRSSHARIEPEVRLRGNRGRYGAGQPEQICRLAEASRGWRPP